MHIVHKLIHLVILVLLLFLLILQFLPLLKLLARDLSHVDPVLNDRREEAEHELHPQHHVVRQKVPARANHRFDVIQNPQLHVVRVQQREHEVDEEARQSAILPMRN